jgi:ketosteroid isomerase-like protein
MKTVILLYLLFVSISFSQIDEKEQISELIDLWHKAAEIADKDSYFNFMDDEGIFLGTDATERWTKKEFMEWSSRYFEKAPAWILTPIRREIILAKEKIFAWFDEDLNTSMGPCRGSGVLVKKGNGWKLVHYNLALTIPNEAIKEIKSILKEKLDSKK